MLPISPTIRKTDLSTCQTSIDSETAFELTSCLEMPSKIGEGSASRADSNQLPSGQQKSAGTQRLKKPSIGLEPSFLPELSAEVEDN